MYLNLCYFVKIALIVRDNAKNLKKLLELVLPNLMQSEMHDSFSVTTVLCPVKLSVIIEIRNPHAKTCRQRKHHIIKVKFWNALFVDSSTACDIFKVNHKNLISSKRLREYDPFNTTHVLRSNSESPEALNNLRRALLTYRFFVGRIKSFVIEIHLFMSRRYW